jgi:hypothetical protein
MMYVTVTVCNPDDPTLCIDMDCNEDGYCCYEGECADCSDADPENFNPDDCVEDELYR